MRRRLTLAPVGLAILGLSISLLTGCPTDSGGGGGGTGIFNLPPTVVLTADVQRGVAPLMVRFSSSGSTDDGVILERHWSFGDGQESIEIAPIHTYLTTGVFTATLTLTDDAGASASKSLQISVTERPIAVITVNTKTAPAAPATVRFDGSASFDPDAQQGDVLLFSWDFGDGSRFQGTRDEAAVVDHKFARAGTFTVILTVTDATGITGTTSTIIEIGIRHPEISFRSPMPTVTNIVCENDSPLWVTANFDVEAGVPYQLSAGLDGDLDRCNALTVLYNPATGSEYSRLTGNGGIGHDGPVQAAAFSPDGGTVATAGDDGTVRFYDTETGSYLRRFVGAYGGINTLAYSADGSRLALGADDGTIALLDPRDAAAASPLIRDDFAGHTGSVNSVAISPDGTQVLSGGNDGLAILWATADASQIIQFVHLVGATPQAVYAVAFWPLNPQVITTGAADNTARMWSALDGGLIQQFGPVFSGGVQVAGHTGAVRALAFTTDGLQLLTGGADATARLWSVLDGAQMRVFSGHTDTVNSVDFSNDDLTAATGGADGTVRIWDIPTGGEIPPSPLTPCVSPVTSVEYSPDGTRLLASIAARNDIRLDTNPPQGNDLNLTLPTALDLSDVPYANNGKQYYLWVEIDTDRTQPSRTYANLERTGYPTVYTVVNMVPPFGSSAGSATHAIPLRSIEEPAGSGIFYEDAYVIVPPISPLEPAPRRQVFDIGAVAAGDRLFTSLLTTPGYAKIYSLSGSSLQVVDSQQRHFAWYQQGTSLFSPDDRLLFGHASPRQYISVDDSAFEYVPSVFVRVQRDVAADALPREQKVYLQFGATAPVSIGGSIPVSLSAFDAGGDSNAVIAAMKARLTALFAAYDVTISSSDTDAPPAGAHTTIYFDTAAYPADFLTLGDVPASALLLYGLPDQFDVRNQTVGGRAIVIVPQVEDAITVAVTDTILGQAIANSVAHQIGLLVGLRETTGVATDVMGRSSDVVVQNLGLTFNPGGAPSLRSYSGIAPIGNQNGHQYLLEVVGAP